MIISYCVTGCKPQTATSPSGAASEAQQEKVTAALKQRLGRDVELRCTTDAALLGGAVIRAGDLVIDGSVRGKLERLGAALNH